MARFDFGSFLETVGPSVTRAGGALASGITESEKEKQRKRKAKIAEGIAELTTRQATLGIEASEREAVKQEELEKAFTTFDIAQGRAAGPLPEGVTRDLPVVPPLVPVQKTELESLRSIVPTRLQARPEFQAIAQPLIAAEKQDFDKIEKQNTALIKQQELDEKREWAERTFKQRGERNLQLSQEANKRIVISSQNSFNNSKIAKGVTEASQYIRAAIFSIEQDDFASDIALVKATEKLLQDGAVLEGEADAYKTAGTFTGRLATAGLWDAAKGVLTGRIPGELRKQMFDLSKELYNGRIEQFEKDRKRRFNLGVKVIKWTEEEANVIFPERDFINTDLLNVIVGKKGATSFKSANIITQDQANKMSDAELSAFQASGGKVEGL